MENRIATDDMIKDDRSQSINISESVAKKDTGNKRIATDYITKANWYANKISESVAKKRAETKE